MLVSRGFAPRLRRSLALFLSAPIVGQAVASTEEPTPTPPAVSTDSLAGIRLPVTKHVLENGMRVLLVPWGDAPFVATYLRFDVGGVDDPKGLTGVAHLLEHMMFKGTTTLGTTDWEKERPLLDALNALYAERDRARLSGADSTTLAELDAAIAEARAKHEPFVVKNEIWQIYERCGGTGLNASTSNDSTQYYLTLPANQLEVWARIESDRILNPVFREFFSERDVVHEERRMRVDSSARGRFSELFDANAWLVHPYRQPVIGWPEDIDATEYDEVLRYFRTWYAPNNCVAVLVGQVDPATTFPLIEKWFARIPRQELSRRRNTPEPLDIGERRFSAKLDSPSSIQIGWHVPAYGHADNAALTVAARLLNGSGGFGRGRSSSSASAGRLRAKLVDEAKLASRASASVGFGRYPGLFQLSASPARDASIADLEAAIYRELERLATEPPTDDELARVRRAVTATSVRSLRSSMGIAGALAEAEMLAGDWRAIETDREAILAVTSEDVARVARRWFRVENRVVGVLDGTREEPREETPPAEEGSR